MLNPLKVNFPKRKGEALVSEQYTRVLCKKESADLKFPILNNLLNNSKNNT